MLGAFYRPLYAGGTGAAEPARVLPWRGDGEDPLLLPGAFPMPCPSPGSRRPCWVLFAPRRWTGGPMYGGLVPAGGSSRLQRFPCPSSKQIASGESYAGRFFIRAGLKLWKMYCNSTEPRGSS